MYYKKKVAILKSSGKTQRAEVSTVVPCPVLLHYSSWGFHKLKQRPQRGPSSYKTLLRTRALDLWITRACRALTNHMGCTRLVGRRHEKHSCKYLKKESPNQQLNSLELFEYQSSLEVATPRTEFFLEQGPSNGSTRLMPCSSS